jgi:hypothetical protein
MALSAKEKSTLSITNPGDTMPQAFEETVEQYRQKAFAIAESTSPAYLAKLSSLVQHTIETGATFDEFRAAVQRLDNTWQAAEYIKQMGCRCRRTAAPVDNTDPQKFGSNITPPGRLGD